MDNIKTIMGLLIC